MQAVPYSRYNFSGISQPGVLVRMLHWHPEISDNIFACCLTNGALDVVYVSDADRSSSVITILTHYTTDRLVTAFAWSPKGKQIVVAFRQTAAAGAHFSQFKLTIDEKNLVQNIPFDEVKKVSLAVAQDDLRPFHVINICWLSTFVFAVVLYNGAEDATRYLIVSLPSAKATGEDALMKLLDFGCLNIDSTTAAAVEVNLQQLENVIFTTSSRSGSVALLACPSPGDIAAYSRWGEVAQEDDASLVLPTFAHDSGEEDSFATVRGLALTRGTARQFRFSSSEVKGGPGRPLALTYNAAGQLTLFLVDYEPGGLAAGGAFLSAPAPPPTAPTKPVVSPAVVNLATTPGIAATPPPQQQLQQQNAFSTASSGQAKVFAAGSSSFSSTPNKAVSFGQQTRGGGESLASLLAASESPSATPPPPHPQQQRQQQQQQPNYPPPVYEPISPVEPPKQPQQQQPQPEPPCLDALCAEECQLTMGQFSGELGSLLRSLRATLAGAEVGTGEQFDRIRCEFEFIDGMLETLAGQYAAFTADVGELQVSENHE